MRLVQPLATKGYKVVDKNSLTDCFGIGEREGHLDSNLNLGHAIPESWNWSCDSLMFVFFMSDIV